MLNKSSTPKYRLERAFLRFTTPADRELLKRFIGAVLVAIAALQIFVINLVVRRLLSKNFLIAGGTLLTLFGIYLAIVTF